MKLNDADTWALIVSLFALIISVFKEVILPFIFKSNLILSPSSTPPDSHPTYIGAASGGTIKVFFFRLKVENTGKGAARNVEVMLSSIEKFSDQKNPNELKGFLPQSLKWSHVNSVLRDNIPPGSFRFLDIGCCMEMNFLGERPLPYRFHLYTETDPIDYSNIIEPGCYRLTLKIIADGSLKVSNHYLLLDLPAERFYSAEPPNLNDVKFSICYP